MRSQHAKTHRALLSSLVGVFVELPQADARKGRHWTCSHHATVSICKALHWACLRGPPARSVLFRFRGFRTKAHGRCGVCSTAHAEATCAATQLQEWNGDRLPLANLTDRFMPTHMNGCCSATDCCCAGIRNPLEGHRPQTHNRHSRCGLGRQLRVICKHLCCVNQQPPSHRAQVAGDAQPWGPVPQRVRCGSERCVCKTQAICSSNFSVHRRAGSVGTAAPITPKGARRTWRFFSRPLR
jgi:hypothetical protein